MAGDRANVSAPLLYSNSLHRKVGEAVPTLHPRSFISFRRYMIRIVFLSALLSAIYSLLVYLRDIYMSEVVPSI